MNKCFFTLTALFVLAILPHNVSAAIYQVNTMEEASGYFDDADASTMAIFDVNALIQPADPAFQAANVKRHKAIAKEILGSLTFDERMNFFTLIGIKSAPILIETRSYSLFEDLDTKGVKRIALSGNLTGSFRDAGSLEDMPSLKLALVGINFSHSFSSNQPIVFNSFWPYRCSYPLFKHGVLSTNGGGTTRGEVLVSLLQRVNYAPDTLVYISERKAYLHQVEMALCAYYPDIEFIGLHYTGANDYLTPCISEAKFRKKWCALAQEAKEYVIAD